MWAAAGCTSGSGRRAGSGGSARGKPFTPVRRTSGPGVGIASATGVGPGSWSPPAGRHLREPWVARVSGHAAVPGRDRVRAGELQLGRPRLRAASSAAPLARVQAERRSLRATGGGRFARRGLHLRAVRRDRIATGGGLGWCLLDSELRKFRTFCKIFQSW